MVAPTRVGEAAVPARLIIVAHAAAAHQVMLGSMVTGVYAAGVAPPIQPSEPRIARNWSCGKALSVVVRTLPAEPTVSMKRAAVSSSGASQTST